jgi:hypothetical protein
VSDDDLRALERALDGLDVEGRIRYAHALDRGGRRDDALDALLPARSDPRARSEIAKFPAWDTSTRGSDGASFLDARPIRRNPRLSWVVDDPRRGLEGLPLGLTVPHALTPLVFVSSWARHSTALDAATGETLWEREAWDTTSCLVRGEHLLTLGWEGLEVRDTWTGELVARHARPSGRGSLHILGKRLVVDGRGETIVYDLTDPLQPPRELWRAPGEPTWAPPEELVLVTRTSPRFERYLARVVDVNTGEERVRLEGPRVHWVWFADRELVVFKDRDGHHAYERDGRHRWSVFEPSLLGARTERCALALDVRRDIDSANRRLIRVECATGEVTTLRRGQFESVAPVIARDVFHAVERQEPTPVIAAFTLEGEPLWRLELPELEGLQVTNLSLLQGGLLGIAQGANGRLFRLVGD